MGSGSLLCTQLAAADGAGAHASAPMRRICDGDQAFMQYLGQVKERLQGKGATPDLQAYVEDLMVQVGFSG